MLFVELPGWVISWCIEKEGTMHIYPLLLNMLRIREGTFVCKHKLPLCCFTAQWEGGKAHYQTWIDTKLDNVAHFLLWCGAKRTFLLQSLCGLSWGAGWLQKDSLQVLVAVCCDPPQVMQHGERGRRGLKWFSGRLQGASVSNVGGSMVEDARGAGVWNHNHCRLAPG